MRRVIGHWLDVLLGPRCVCGERVFPKDQARHDDLEHAGDQLLPRAVTVQITEDTVSRLERGQQIIAEVDDHARRKRDLVADMTAPLCERVGRISAHLAGHSCRRCTPSARGAAR